MWIQRKIFVFCALLAAVFAARGEDIDIYSAFQSNGDNPNLMILLDNSAAWDASVSFTCPGFSVPANNAGKAVGFEQCALYNAVNAIGNSESLVGNINMGLMLFGSGSTNGGELKVPSTSPYTMPTMNTAGITSFGNTVAALDRNGDKSNGSAVGASMQEVWAYYSGNTGLSGKSYSPHFISGCQRNFVVYIANANNFGKPQDQGQTAINALGAAGATAAQQTQIDIATPDDKYEENWADEWARFMYQTDMSTTLTDQQNIITYTIIVSDGKNPEYVKFLTSMATQGGGKYFLVTLGDMDALVQALLQIFNEVQGVNSAFSSSSLPVSANAQGQYLNQVFMGVFRPDTGALPRWQGNLKQYKLAADDINSSETLLVDANGNDAISGADSGFISPTAVSFWTSYDGSTLPDSAGGFWVKTPNGPAGGFDLKSPGTRTPKTEASPGDGDIVEKGGAHQRIRLAYQKVNYADESTSPQRKLYTCTTGCNANSNLSSTPFALSNTSITAALLGSSAPSIPISSIARSDSTNKATVTLSSAPNPALTNGQTVTISGATNTEFNGAFSVTVLDSTHFTYDLPASSITPPTPASGSFEVSVAAATVDISSLVRSGATVTATTASPHGLLGGTVAIAGAAQSEYNGNKTITVTGTNTFTYTITTSPAVPTIGGTVVKGGESFTFAPSDVAISNLAATTQNVTITNSANGNTPPKTWVTGNSVTISGVTPAAYNGTWTMTNAGSSCAGGSNNKSICFTMSTTPTTPATLATGVTKITASTGGTNVPAVSLSRALSTCAVNASYVGTGTTTVNATFTTAAASPHGLVTGQTVGITGTPSTLDQGAYLPSAVTVTVTSPNSFTYPITVTPACSAVASTGGMQATPSGVDRNTLIRWVRGEDNALDEPNPDSTHVNINIRPSIHGDVLHSRPIVINYGGDIGVVAFYGSNDGVFRAVNGNQVNPEDSTLPAPGDEMWGFIPEEFFSRFNRLRTNSPQIKLSSTPTGITPTPLAKDYFFDGATGAYQNTVTEKVYLYLSARRGGRLIYALDVSDPMTPKFMWKRSSTDTAVDSRFAILGQTWSQPKVLKIRGWPNPVVAFGAGYNPSEDAQPAAAYADEQGRGIFLLDALDGSIVWTASRGGSSNSCTGTTDCKLNGMTHAVASDLTAVDRDFDGYIDRLYAPDLGGNVWRVDLEPSFTSADPTSADPDTWQATLFASVGGTPGAGADKRKIFYPPSVASAPGYDAVLLATGDREHPVASDAAALIKNRFYMLKDTNVGKDGSKAANGTDPWAPVTDSSSTTAFATTADLFDATSTTYSGVLGGFYIDLQNAGEKSVNAPVSVGGSTFFATNSPTTSNTSCEAGLGDARGYKINFFTGESNSIVFPGGGMPPTAVVATVTLDNGQTRQVCIGCGAGPQGLRAPAGAGNTDPLPGSPRKRSFWYEKR